MTPLQAAIWAFMRERFAGGENATPRATIIARYNLLRHADLDDRTFRDAVSDLVSTFKKPICTTAADGYYVARTEREKMPALNYLDALIQKAVKRRRGLAEAITEERQERLF